MKPVNGQFDSNTAKLHAVAHNIKMNRRPQGELGPDSNEAAMKHFNRMGYNKGTAGDMLAKSKARLAESVEAAGNVKARKASHARTADREEARRQERGE